MLCRQCGINNPESNTICFHCKTPLVSLSDLEIDTHLDENHARFRISKNLSERFYLIQDYYFRSIQFANQQYQFLKRPWIAAWLSLIPGLGQLYNGQRVKAIPFLLSAVALITLFLLFIKEDISNWFFIFYCGIILLAFMDAFSTAIIKNQGSTVSKRQFMSLFFYGMFVMGITILLLHWFSYGIVQFTTINNSSLQPYLMKWDKIGVKRYVYWFANPKRGDIVFYLGNGFTAQDGENLWLIGQGFNIERVIGLPGETVLFKNRKIYVNGDPLPDKDYPLVTKSMPENLTIQLSKKQYFILRSVIPQPGDTMSDKLFTVLGTPTSHNATIFDDENWRKASVVSRKDIFGKLGFIFNPPAHRRFF